VTVGDDDDWLMFCCVSVASVTLMKSSIGQSRSHCFNSARDYLKFALILEATGAIQIMEKVNDSARS